jgi:hypothetical protein
MTVSILRWKGGSGGDMLLYIKSLSHPGSVVNAVYRQVEDTGKTIIDYSNVNFSDPREIEKIALSSPWIEQISQDKLSRELTQYDQQPANVWLKSHYYNTDLFNNYTLDLVVDPVSLPFVILSNVTKTDTLTRNFHNLIDLIKDDSVRLKYIMYMVGRDCVYNFTNLSAQQIPVSSLLVDLDTFVEAIGKTNLDLDLNLSYVYQYWLDHNLQRLPSPRYCDKVLSQDFDFMNTDLSLVERYSLLVLSKKNKFVNLC